MFTVVVHEEGRAVAEVIEQRFHQCPTGLFGHTHGRCDLARDETGVGDRCKLDQPHAVVGVDTLGRRLKGEPGLAHAANPGERDQPAFVEEADDFCELTVSAHE